MFFQIRTGMAFLAGTCLMGAAAHAQIGWDCAPDCGVAAPNCAVAEPNCAIGEVTCGSVPRRPVRYYVPRPTPQKPAYPVKYRVVGGSRFAPCTSMPCEDIGCTLDGCADVGCADYGCSHDCCVGGSCLDCKKGLCGPGGICLTGGTVKQKYRNLSRDLYYKSFDHHRHLHHPIVSPASSPSHGYNQTCWDRFPEETLWCPPCYGESSPAASLYNAPMEYPATEYPSMMEYPSMESPGMIVPGEEYQMPLPGSSTAPPTSKPPGAPPASSAPSTPNGADTETYEPPVRPERATPDATPPADGGAMQRPEQADQPAFPPATPPSQPAFPPAEAPSTPPAETPPAEMPFNDPFGNPPSTDPPAAPATPQQEPDAAFPPASALLYVP